MKNRILLVDDDNSTFEVIGILLESMQYKIDYSSDGLQALAKLKKEQFDLVITDLCMPNMDGMELLRQIKKDFSDIEVIITTAFMSIDTAISAMKMGAYDYLTKPIDDMQRVRLVIEKSLEKVRIQRENRTLKSQIPLYEHSYCGIIGKSKRMQEVFSLIDKVAKSDTSVLIQGESGTGKELVAQAIHAKSRRSENNLVPVDCGSLHRQLLESELFGHTKGSFTGAVADKKGLFEEASGGTLFLDEISSTDCGFQAKLLRALQEKEIKRVGGTKRIPIDIRLIVASNKDLHQAVQEEKFREDLYYRINIVNIDLPPLRERKEDLSLLCSLFLQKYTKLIGKRICSIDEQVLRLFGEYSWPGNIRELENTIERAVILANSDKLEGVDLPPQIRQAKGKNFLISDTHRVFADAKESFERNYFINLLKLNNGNVSLSARKAGMLRQSLQHKLKKYGIISAQYKNI